MRKTECRDICKCGKILKRILSALLLIIDDLRKEALVKATSVMFYTISDLMRQINAFHTSYTFQVNIMSLLFSERQQRYDQAILPHVYTIKIFVCNGRSAELNIMHFPALWYPAGSGQTAEMD